MRDDTGIHEDSSRSGDSAANLRVTHRVGLTLGVHAADDEQAGRIAELFYERFAQEVKEVDGVLWLLPVADIKESRGQL